MDKTKEPPPRTRRYSQDEIDRLVFVSGFSFDSEPTTAISRVGASVLFAIETAMRAGGDLQYAVGRCEFCQCNGIFAENQNGFARTIPLSSVAVKILRGLETVKQDDQTVFQIKSASHDAIFRKMKELTGLDNEDLHFCKRLNYFA